MDHTIEEHPVQNVDNIETEPDQKEQAIAEPKNFTIPIYHVYAGFWIRFFAYIIDMIVVASLNRILVHPILRWLDISLHESSMLSTVAISTAIVMFVYYIVMTKVFSQTLGKMILGLKVISESEPKLSWGTVIFRELIGKFISKTVLFLGFITIGFTVKKKGWHDFLADTIVIQERKGVPLLTSNLNNFKPAEIK
ncbi:RDD family protein [Schinkia sp. CFF1]